MLILYHWLNVSRYGDISIYRCISSVCLMKKSSRKYVCLMMKMLVGCRLLTKKSSKQTRVLYMSTYFQQFGSVYGFKVINTFAVDSSCIIRLHSVCIQRIYGIPPRNSGCTFCFTRDFIAMIMHPVHIDG